MYKNCKTLAHKTHTLKQKNKQTTTKWATHVKKLVKEKRKKTQPKSYKNKSQEH